MGFERVNLSALVLRYTQRSRSSTQPPTQEPKWLPEGPETGNVGGGVGAEKLPKIFKQTFVYFTQNLCGEGGGGLH